MPTSVRAPGDNASLADRRAIHVHVKLEKLFEDAGINYDVTWYRLGEIERPQPGETKKTSSHSAVSTSS